MEKMSKLFDVLGKIVAILLVLLFVTEIVNAIFGFIDTEAEWGVALTNAIFFAKNFGALLLVAIVTLEAVSKCPLLVRIVFYVCIAIVVIAWFFPSVYENLISYIPVK